MIYPIVYADLKRIIRSLRCEMSDADVISVVAEILKYGLHDETEDLA